MEKSLFKGWKRTRTWEEAINLYMCPILCLHPLFFPHHLKGNFSQRSTLFVRAYPTWLVSYKKSWHCMFRQLALRKSISWASDHTLQMLQGHGNEWQLRRSYRPAVVGASHPAPAAGSPQPSLLHQQTPGTQQARRPRAHSTRPKIIKREGKKSDTS